MKKFLKNNWLYFLAGIGIIALYFVRLYHLTLLPVFADEAIYIRWSQIMANEPTLRFLPLSDGKQPLYMWILMLLIKRFSDPLFIGRMISVVSGFGTLAGVCFLSYLLFKNKAATLIAGLLYALSPFVFFFDRMALVDSMLTALGVWSLTFAVLTAKTKRLDIAMIMGFFFGLSWLTKSTATLFILLIPATWILLSNKKDILRVITLDLIAVFIAFVMYNILRLGPNFGLIATRNLDYVYPINHILVNPFDPLKGHLGGIVNYFYLMAPVSLVALFLLGYLVGRRKHWKELLVLSFWAIGPILATAEYFKVVTARYLVYTIPFFIVIAASAFLTKARLIKILAVAALLILVIQSGLFDYKLLTKVEETPFPAGEKTGYLTEWTAGYGIKEVGDYLKSQIPSLKSDQKIVVGTEGYFGTLPDGLQMYMEGIGKATVIGVGLGFERVPDPLVASRDAGNKTYLVINKSRLYIKNPEMLGLRLISSYPKPLRDLRSTEYANFGPQDSLLFFEVK